MSSEPFQMGSCQQKAPHSGWKWWLDWSYQNIQLPRSQLSCGSRASTGENLCVSAEYRMRRSTENEKQSGVFSHVGWKERAYLLFILPAQLPQNGHQSFIEKRDFYKPLGNAITFLAHLFGGTIPICSHGPKSERSPRFMLAPTIIYVPI